MRCKLMKEMQKKPITKLKNQSSQKKSIKVAASLNFSECKPENQFVLIYFKHESEQDYHIPRITKVNFDNFSPKKKTTAISKNQIIHENSFKFHLQ